MKITKKQLIRLIKEQVNNNSNFDQAIFKATDLCRIEFENAVGDGRDEFSNFEDLVKKYLGRPLTNREKNDSEYKKTLKLIDNLCELNSDIEMAYRTRGKAEGKKAESKFESLLNKL